jgi:hypothetical protein
MTGWNEKIYGTAASKTVELQARAGVSLLHSEVPPPPQKKQQTIEQSVLGEP